VLLSVAAPRLRRATRIERWSLANAFVMVGAVGVSVALDALWLLTLIGTAMLAVLTGVASTRWTPSGTFGGANLLTALRLAAIVGLSVLPAGTDPWIFGLGLAILLTDGLDGWLARRYGWASEFGEFFDKETDTLFVVLLCSMATLHGDVSPWIVAVGALRYPFVLTLFLAQPTVSKEPRSDASRYIYVGFVLALLGTFVLDPMIARPLLWTAVMALLWSFGRSFAWALRRWRGSDSPRAVPR
jgi:phosphatidylglycerophosphate synthase